MIEPPVYGWLNVASVNAFVFADSVRKDIDRIVKRLRK